MNNRADELWRLIRFTKDATPKQITEWCKELNDLLIQGDDTTYILGAVEDDYLFNLTPQWLEDFEAEREGT